MGACFAGLKVGIALYVLVHEKELFKGPPASGKGLPALSPIRAAKEDQNAPADRL